MIVLLQISHHMTKDLPVKYKLKQELSPDNNFLLRSSFLDIIIIQV